MAETSDETSNPEKLPTSFKALDQDEIIKFKIAYYDAISAFEMLVFGIITSIMQAFMQAGLKNTQMANAVVAHQTAEPLMKTWYSTFYSLVENDPAMVIHLKSIRKAVVNALEKRNILAHTVFWGSDNVDIANTGLLTLLLRHGSQGVVPLSKNVRTCDLVEFKSECDAAAGAIAHFAASSQHPELKAALEQAMKRLNQNKP